MSSHMTTQTPPALSGAINPQANIYFDGKCISHSIALPDGSRKSVGVILPSCLRFTTQSAEVMQIVAGQCEVQLAGSSSWQAVSAGQSFDVPAHSAFEIRTEQPLHYICHFS
jgi:purine/pyrimidine-nucleoside phosphorylase